MPIADLVELIAHYWYIPVIVALCVALKVDHLRIDASAGRLATANAEIKTQNVNFASLEAKATEQNSEVQSLHVQLEQKQAALDSLTAQYAKQSADAKASARTLINSIDAAKSCLQAQQDAVRFYRSHK